MIDLPRLVAVIDALEVKDTETDKHLQRGDLFAIMGPSPSGMHAAPEETLPEQMVHVETEALFGYALTNDPVPASDPCGRLPVA